MPNMKFLMTASLLVTLLFSIEATTGDHYKLTFSKGKPNRVSIEAHIFLEDSLLYMSPNGPMPERWPYFVRNLLVEDELGNSVPVVRNDTTSWILQGAEKLESIQLYYEVALEHEQFNWPGGIDGVAFQKPWGTMLSGRSVFIMNGKDKMDIGVQFVMPDGYHLTSPWDVSPEKPEQLEVSNYFDLQESLIFVGTHKEIIVEKSDFTLRFVLGGAQMEAGAEQYGEIANRLLDYYINLMGGNPSINQTGKKTNILVLMNESEQTDGEVIGNHISILLNPNGPPQEQIIGWFLFAHEFFHLWNGKTLQFENTETDWFKEGVTNYYTMKALQQIGFLEEESMLMVLNNLFYKRYIQDKGLGELAPAKAASGFDKDNHWGLVYGGGLFAGICLDMEIRNQTKNQKSLDDVMRFFYKNAIQQGPNISNTAILEKCNEASGLDLSPIFTNNIYGLQQPPIEKALELAGKNVQTEGGQLIITSIENPTTLQKDIWQGFLGEN